jgi:hypothetical protein
MPLPASPMSPVVYERNDGGTSAPLAPTYRPRNPQSPALYRVVRDHLETFSQPAPRPKCGSDRELQVQPGAGGARWT